MDQTSVLFVVSIFILLFIIIGSGLVVWVAWQKSRRERLGNMGKIYRRMSPPEARVHQRPPLEIRWGEGEEIRFRHNGVSGNEEINKLLYCPLCKHVIDNKNEHTCLNCGEKYHQTCWIEYYQTCVICGKEED